MHVLLRVEFVSKCCVLFTVLTYFILQTSLCFFLLLLILDTLKSIMMSRDTDYHIIQLSWNNQLCELERSKFYLFFSVNIIKCLVVVAWYFLEIKIASLVHNVVDSIKTPTHSTNSPT